MANTAKIGSATVPRPGFGAMGLSAFYSPNLKDLEPGKATLRKAIEIGCTLWNTADMYGNGKNEDLIGSVLAEGDNRSKVFLVTKFGNKWTEGVPGYVVDGSPEYTRKAISASLERLKTNPDAIAVHRVDKKTPIEDTVRAMQEFRDAGKVKFLGISECSAETLRRANKVVKIDFIEVEYSPWTLDMEKNGVLDAAKELGVAVLAYSPLGRGFLTGRFKKPEDFGEGDSRLNMPRMQKENFDQNYKIVEELEKVAKKKGCTPGQLSLAWLMAQGDNIIPVPGTKSEKYLVENFNSRDIKLTDEELAEIRQVVSGYTAQGTRYAAPMMNTLDN